MSEKKKIATVGLSNLFETISSLQSEIERLKAKVKEKSNSNDFLNKQNQDLISEIAKLSSKLNIQNFWENQYGKVQDENEKLLKLINSSSTTGGKLNPPLSTEGVRELLKKQREIIAELVNYPYRDEFGCHCDVPSIVLNAPEPELSTPLPPIVEEEKKEERKSNWSHHSPIQTPAKDLPDDWMG